MASKMLFLAIIIGFLGISSPKTADASIISTITNWINNSAEAATSTSVIDIGSVPTGSLTASVLEAAVNIDPVSTSTETETAIVSNSALLSEAGPDAAAADAYEESNDQISVYTVHDGDTLASVAKMFNVSVNTIIMANDITDKTIKPGQVLVILPISGVKYIVKKGDTIKAIATKYGGNVDEIIDFNNLPTDGSLTAGDEIIIPGGSSSVSTPSTSSKTTKSSATTYQTASGYFKFPLPASACHRTQGLHGWNRNAVDYGCPVGTPIYAAAEGTVLISLSYGYNGGYGEYVVIQHPNGTQTVYGHLSQVKVSSGQKVKKGQQIGLSGNTGRSTGPHLHFEMRGAKNPF